MRFIFGLLSIALTVGSQAASASEWSQNGSIMSLESNGQERRFKYSSPRPGLLVENGFTLFDGKRICNKYSGIIYLFSSKCNRIAYEVVGDVSESQRGVVLTGQKPKRDAKCNVIGYEDDRLVFTLREARQANAPKNTENLYLTCAEKKRTGYVLEEYEIDYCGGLQRKDQVPSSNATAENERRRKEGERRRAQEQERRERAEQESRESQRREEEEQNALRERQAEAERARLAANTLVIEVRSLHANTVELSFYSQSFNRAWPGGSRVYPLADSEFHTYRLNCQPSERICYGAWVSGDSSSYWGVGNGGEQGCTDCCMTCGSSNRVTRVTLNGSNGEDTPTSNSGPNLLGTAVEILNGFSGAGAYGRGGGTRTYTPTPPQRRKPRESDISGTR